MIQIKLPAKNLLKYFHDIALQMFSSSWCQNPILPISLTDMQATYLQQDMEESKFYNQ